MKHVSVPRSVKGMWHTLHLKHFLCHSILSLLLNKNLSSIGSPQPAQLCISEISYFLRIVSRNWWINTWNIEIIQVLKLWVNLNPNVYYVQNVFANHSVYDCSHDVAVVSLLAPSCLASKKADTEELIRLAQ